MPGLGELFMNVSLSTRMHIPCACGTAQPLPEESEGADADLDLGPLESIREQIVARGAEQLDGVI